MPGWLTKGAVVHKLWDPGLITLKGAGDTPGTESSWTAEIPGHTHSSTSKGHKKCSARVTIVIKIVQKLV